MLKEQAAVKYKKITASEFRRWRNSVMSTEGIPLDVFKKKFLKGLSRALQEKYSKKDLEVLAPPEIISCSSLELLYYFEKNKKNSFPQEPRIIFVLSKLNISLEFLWSHYAKTLLINMAKDKLPNENHLVRKTQLLEITDSITNTTPRPTQACTPSLTALIGAGGIGKSYLAAGLGTNSLIESHFSDGILWLQLSNEASNISNTAPYQDIETPAKLLLTKHQTQLGKIPKAKAGNYTNIQKLASLIHDKSILLIVDNIWSASAIQPLLTALQNNNSTHCHVLITTRQQLVINSLDIAAKNIIEVSPLSREEASYLLQQRCNTNIPPQLMKKILPHSGYWPLMLELIAGQVNNELQLISHKEPIHQNSSTIEQACNNVVIHLESGGVLTIHDQKRDRPHQSVSTCVEASATYLQVLDNNTPIHGVNRLERFYSLAVFPNNTIIPYSVLALYWGDTLGTTITICEDISDLRLLNITYDESYDERCIEIHSLVLAYLQAKSKQKNNYSGKQQCLLDAFQSQYNHFFIDDEHTNNYSVSFDGNSQQVQEDYFLSYSSFHCLEAENFNAGLSSAWKSISQPNLLKRLSSINIHNLLGSTDSKNVAAISQKLTLAIALSLTGELNQAESIFRDLIRYSIDLDKGHPLIIRATYMLGNTLVMAGQYTEAIRVYETAVQACLSKYGQHHPETLTANVWYAFGLYIYGNTNKAKLVIQAVLKVANEFWEDTHPQIITAQMVLSNCLLQEGQFKEAEVLADWVVERSQNISEQSFSQHLILRGTLGLVYMWAGKPEEARRLSQDAITAYQNEDYIAPQILISISITLGAALLRLCRFEEAKQHLDYIIEETILAFGDQHPLLVTYLTQRACYWLIRGNIKQAKKEAELSIALTSEHLPSSHISVPYAQLVMVIIYLAEAQFSLAADLSEKGYQNLTKQLSPNTRHAKRLKLIRWSLQRIPGLKYLLYCSVKAISFTLKYYSKYKSLT